MAALFADGALGFAKRVHAGVSEMSRGATLNSFLLFPPLPEGDGNRSPSGFSAKKVEQLAQGVLSTITSLKTLRAHGLSINYTDDVLLSMFYELKDLHEAITKQSTASSSPSSFNENDHHGMVARIGPHAILEVSLSHVMSLPEERPSVIPDDSVSLYVSRAPHPTPQQFMDVFMKALIASPMVDSAGFSGDEFEKDPVFEMLTNHAVNVANNGVDSLMAGYLKIFQEIEGVERRVIVKNADAPKVEKPNTSKTADLLKASYAARHRA